MILRITIPVSDASPTDPATLNQVDSTAAQQAATWTAPVYIGEADGLWTYEVDAVPRTRALTTDNIAPTLLPPHIA